MNSLLAVSRSSDGVTVISKSCHYHWRAEKVLYTLGVVPITMRSILLEILALVGLKAVFS